MSEAKPDYLKELRDQIDALDTQMLALMNRRGDLASHVAAVKRREQSDGEPEFYRPEREREVLNNLLRENRGPLDNAAVVAIFRELMSGCRALEKMPQVAYLGPEGTFTQEAAARHFGHATKLISCRAISEVFSTVESISGMESGSGAYGVVPVENSTEGVVTHTLGSFLDSPLRICGEVELPVHLHLMVRKDSEAEHVQWIVAHPQALAQCRNRLDRDWRHVGRKDSPSNGEAALQASEMVGTAALASQVAADLYGLKIIAHNMQDRSDNSTRFLVIGRDRVRPSGRDRTSLIASIKNRPGALYELLAPFQNVQMTCLESHPSRQGAETFMFFIEFEGHEEQAEIKKILDIVREKTVKIQVLGSYPRADRRDLNMENGVA